MKTAIANLSKWTEKTVAVIRRICNSKPGPCVGMALLFVDPTASKENQWNFVIELAGDPNNPIAPEERADLQRAFEHIMGGLVNILDGAIEETPSEFEARGTFH